ncbi:MAG: NADH-quinone oxidoreductase subunit K [Candidatus Brocadiia bacterium]|jgi:hydrogenase-4 component E
MSGWIDVVMVALILTNLVVLGSSRLNTCIRVIALQGVALGTLPLMAGPSVLPLRMIALTAGTMGLKGVVFPWLLLRAMRQAEVRREVEPYVGYIWSVVVGLVSLGVSVWLGARLPLPGPVHPTLAVPVALFMIFVGLFVIISRRTALSQILGYIILENGIYAFAMVILGEVPVLVELGVLLDAFVAVFVMGIAIYHISREFDHVDADQLDTLKG